MLRQAVRNRMPKAGRKVMNAVTAYLYISPAMLIFGVFILLPTLFVVYISVYRWNFLNASTSAYVGLANYRHLLTSSAFWSSLWVTLYFVVLTVPSGVLLSLGIAALLMTNFPGRGLARLGVFAPYATPLVATTIIWIWMFNPQFGLLNNILHAVGLPTPGWLQSPHWAMPSVSVYTLWHSIGFDVIIFMAGLATVPRDLVEAASIEGANAWQRFWRVVWPLISPTTLFVVVISTIEALKAFTQFFTMTAGGPLGATTTTSYLLYEYAFVFYRTGEAAALTVVYFLITAAIALLQFRLSRGRVFYG
ncbi:MAG: sugar ABC transporter permease [Deinococcales bacterium]